MSTARHGQAASVTPFRLATLAHATPLIATRLATLAHAIPLIATRLATLAHAPPLIATRLATLAHAIPLIATRLVTLAHATPDRAVAAALCCIAVAFVGPRIARAQDAAPPSKASAPDPRDETLLQACGEGDARLHEVAAKVAERSSRGRGVPDMHELNAMLRAQGDPHVRPRAWTLRAGTIDRADALARLRAWLSGMRTEGVRRCGVASLLDSERGETLAVVMTDATADLASPVPADVRQSGWVTLEARALVPSSEAKLIVLGPRGSPRTIPTSFDRSSGRVLGRFMADSAGRWVVQLLLTTSSGPQPSLEAGIEAGTGARSAPSREAPGERAAEGQRDDGVAMTVMLNAARKTEGLGSLVRDVRLDAVAERHVRAMMRSGVMAHQAGDGTPVSRLEGAGLSPRELGENVAHATSPALAHRVLWDSPSHRGNMLHTRFKRVGVAAARDGSGHVWVTQVFAGEEVIEQEDGAEPSVGFESGEDLGG